MKWILLAVSLLPVPKDAPKGFFNVEITELSSYTLRKDCERDRRYMIERNKDINISCVCPKCTVGELE